MNFLFVHQNYPGQFIHVLRHLAAADQHEIIFIAADRGAEEIPGVRVILYTRPVVPPHSTAAVQDLDEGLKRAEAVYYATANLRRLGFAPDMIIGHHGWGELLNLRDLWPNVPMLGYFEFYYQVSNADVGFDPEFPIHDTEYPRIRARNAINHLALGLEAAGQTPTAWQRSTYPAWAQAGIDLLWEGVDLQVCQPTPARSILQLGGMTIDPSDQLVTYVARDLEPYRGFHIMMRALPKLLRRKDLKVVIIGGDGVSYGCPPSQGGTWRDVLLAEMGDAIDRSRVLFAGRVPYGHYRTVLGRSDAHIYLTYPFVASWSLREALSIGCPIIGSDTEPVREFIIDGYNGLLVPFLEPSVLANTILNLLEQPLLSMMLRNTARKFAERHLALSDYLARYESIIERLTGGCGMVMGSTSRALPAV